MTQKADIKFKREPKRGSHDFKLACEMLDAGKICHVGFTLDEQPYVLPMAYARMDKQLLIHGSVASRLIKNLATGLRCCVTVTHFDGLVYARSTFNSSMNYRSVMVFGIAKPIIDADEKRQCIQALVDHLMPGRRAAGRIYENLPSKNLMPPVCWLFQLKPSVQNAVRAHPRTASLIWIPGFGLVSFH